MTIHTVGDSHSDFGWSGVTKHHLGPVLCYSFGKEKLERCDIRTFNMVDGDTIIFCFGEIDCRSHVHKYENYQKTITSIVDAYFEAIALNVRVAKLTLQVCVYNVVPPITKHNNSENPDFPYRGTDEERKQYVLYFNQKIKEKCVEYGYIFFDVYHHYVDDQGFLKRELSDGHVHIAEGVHLNDFILEHIKYNPKT
jgi:lysophospholipase L1-like esterase